MNNCIKIHKQIGQYMEVPVMTIYVIGGDTWIQELEEKKSLRFKIIILNALLLEN